MAHYWFISTRYRHSAKLALFTAIFAFVVIILGAYTRLTNAGLSCPDWPHCYGFITAPHTTAQIQDAQARFPTLPVDIKKAWTEMTHRYCAGIEGLLILVLAYSLFFKNKIKDTKSIVIASSLLFLLAVQVTLGMLTVTEQLKPVIVLSHLLTGISILSVLWWAYLDVHLSDDSFVRKTRMNFVPWLWIAVLVVGAQITLGGWVTTHYAGLACVDFPYCNGKLLPAISLSQFNSDLITIHMLHRIGALITAAYLLVLSFYLISTVVFRLIGMLMVFLLGLQICLGIVNILWLRPIPIALMHQSVGIFLLLTCITALVKAYISREKRYGSWIA